MVGAVFLVLLAIPAVSAAQAGAGRPPVGEPATTAEWNSPRATELLIRAQERRQLQQVDTAMLNYQADARGYVYFLLDHPESGRQNLVRTDQVAVDVYWRAPDEVRQHIVGWRERKELPVSRLHYYLDRLTVVQDNYGDGISRWPVHPWSRCARALPLEDPATGGRCPRFLVSLLAVTAFAHASIPSR